MAKKSKGNRILIILRSSVSHFFYTKVKNKTNKEKMVLNKYDPVVRKHVPFNEEKMK